MSIVGYMLGLGDRHGENVLLDAKTGEVVHVDLNCLFNKGLQFAIAEVVPFRLTHNMVDAMGITGYDGQFRLACESTLTVLRKHKETLMCVLEPFVHDPLAEWQKPGTESKDADKSEGRNHLKDIETRLAGKQRVAGEVMTVQGQAQQLIEEATSNNKLKDMYIGWTAYL